MTTDDAHQPLLSSAEEAALARRIECGDESARRRLIEANLRLVAYIARRCQTSGLPVDDLIQEGTIGLMHAVDRFDLRRGVRFSTYAYWWIRKAIIEGAAVQGRAIRLPAYVLRELGRVSEARSQLRQVLGREPTVSDLACELETDHDSLADLLARARPAVAHPLVSTLETEIESGQTWVGSEDADSFELVAAQLRAADLMRLMAELPSWDRELLELRFGLRGGREHSCAEVARLTGVTRQAVSMRTDRVLGRLRAREEVECTRP